jgi:ligand-binding sensor domain-containing protein/signal transduction histidine kinase
MKSFCISIIFCLLILFSVSQNSIAQNENLHFEHISFEEGSSNENITAILQDSRGYIWFGTMRGLNKYDGYSFTKYQFDPFDSNSISQGVIYTIFEDKFGFIWVGTTDGLSRFDRATEKFARFKPSPNSKFSDPNISAINEDSDGMMWVGSFGGLCRFDRQRGIFLPDKFDLIGINTIYKDRTGALWMGSSKGLYRLNLTAKKNNEVSEVNFAHYEYDPGNPYSLSSNNITSIFEDGLGIIWMATDNGLNSFNRKTGKFKRYQHDIKNSQSISTNNLASWLGKSIQEDPGGNLWIGTANGLNKLNAERSAFTSYFCDPDDAYSLSTNNVISLHVDKAGILYASSWGGKLNITNLNVKAFALKRHDPKSINSLSSNAITSMIEDSSGIFWIATYGGGLNRWNKNTNQFTPFRHKPANSTTLRSDTVLVVLEDRHGHLWVGNGGFLSQLNRKTGEFSHYYTNVKNYQDPHGRFVYSITQDSDGFLWLGTGNGVKRFNEKTGEFKHYYHDPADTNSISDGTATAVFTDSKDNIWVGYGSKGTDKFNSRSVRFIHYKYNSYDATGISSNVVNCFFEDSKKNIWLGTLSGGLCLFDYQTGKFSTVTDKDGLPSNTIHSILNDDNNDLWLGTGNGLSHFDPVAKTFINYDYKDGLQSNIFTAGDGDDMSWGGCCKGRDGTLYFGGNNGFNFFNPLNLKANSTIAPIVITQFKLFDKLVNGANESKEIILDYDENYFSFEFSSLSFYNPAKNQYAYQLEGVDKGWVNSGSRRYAGYTNIEPGTYTFKVKGTNNDGIWNEKGTSVIIIIRPPWWRTWWAYCFYGACIIAAIFMTDRYQRKRLINKERERAREKELAQAKEIEKIESQQALLNERLRISRELHDDIGSTLGSISIYSEVAKKRTKKNENINEVLSKIGLASRELIDKMSDIVWSLNPNNENFEQLQSRMMTFAAMMLSSQNIQYDFFVDEELKKIQFTGEQRKNVFLVFKEALHNVVKHAACKKVTITLCAKNNYLIMAIKDDGKGFEPDANILSNESTNSSPSGRLGGAGIKNMHARANDMNAKLLINSRINEGTTVQLTLDV